MRSVFTGIFVYVWQGHFSVVVHYDATKESTLYSLVIVLYTYV